MAVVVTDTNRSAMPYLGHLERFGVALISDVMGGKGLMNPKIRPIQQDRCVAGIALTVSLPPGDNWMLHVAIEQVRDSDLLVVAPTDVSGDGYFGELLATSAQQRGCRGLVTETGVRDTSRLRAMRFPAWSTAVSAKGTVKETLGSINVPITCAGIPVGPGDIIVADDDGVCVIPKECAATVTEKAGLRFEREGKIRDRLQAGELGLDLYEMRSKLKARGLTYRKAGHD